MSKFKPAFEDGILTFAIYRAEIKNGKEVIFGVALTNFDFDKEQIEEASDKVLENIGEVLENKCLIWNGDSFDECQPKEIGIDLKK